MPRQHKKNNRPCNIKYVKKNFYTPKNIIYSPEKVLNNKLKDQIELLNQEKFDLTKQMGDLKEELK